MSLKEKQIVDILEAGGELKIAQITKTADMSKVTALKYLKSLVNNKIVDYKQIGPTKLWYLTNKEDIKKGLSHYEYNKHNCLLEMLKNLKEHTGMEINITIKTVGKS